MHVWLGSGVRTHSALHCKRRREVREVTQEFKICVRDLSRTSVGEGERFPLIFIKIYAFLSHRVRCRMLKNSACGTATVCK